MGVMQRLENNVILSGLIKGHLEINSKKSKVLECTNTCGLILILIYGLIFHLGNDKVECSTDNTARRTLIIYNGLCTDFSNGF